MLKVLLLTLFIFASANIYSQDAQEIIRNVQNKYREISDAKATFSQSVKFNGGKSQSASGTLYIQNENKYRIETGGQTIITDGSTSWTYTPKRKQVVIDHYRDDGNTFSPNKFLFDYPQDFYSDYEGEENVSGTSTYVLKLTPRNKGSVKSAKIWVDKDGSLIRKITVTNNESTTTYTLKSISLNPGVSSSKFTFSPPSGVEVIDLR